MSTNKQEYLPLCWCRGNTGGWGQGMERETETERGGMKASSTFHTYVIEFFSIFSSAGKVCPWAETTHLRH